DEDEDEHLDEAEHPVGLEAGRPREDEQGLDVEHDEEQGEDVVAHLALGPGGADGVRARLVADVLALLRPPGPQGPGDQQEQPEQHEAEADEDADGQVVAKEVAERIGHRPGDYSGAIRWTKAAGGRPRRGEANADRGFVATLALAW